MRNKVVGSSGYSRPHSQAPKEAQYRPWNAKAIMEAKQAKLRESSQENIQTASTDQPSASFSITNVPWDVDTLEPPNTPHVPSKTPNISKALDSPLPKKEKVDDYFLATSLSTDGVVCNESNAFDAQTRSWSNETLLVSPIKEIGPLIDLSMETTKEENETSTAKNSQDTLFSYAYFNRPEISSFIKDLAMLGNDYLAHSTDEYTSIGYPEFNESPSKSLSYSSVHSTQDSAIGNDIPIVDSTTGSPPADTSSEESQDYICTAFQQSIDIDTFIPQSLPQGRQIYSRDELMSLNTSHMSTKGIEAGNLIEKYIKRAAQITSPLSTNFGRSNSNETPKKSHPAPFMRIIRPVINPPDNITKGFSRGRAPPHQIGTIPLYESL
ncbi:hypothetical protein CLU79DRAFT_839019 [Phycomyces nitens]|nr:hypothetical protein CLU79DRAFT_839019 [Phycomyces nitens]